MDMGTLETKGKYELFRTTDGRETINFDNRAYYSFIEEQGKEMIVSVDPDPDKDSSIATGRYFFAVENQDGEKGFLFLEDGDDFRKLSLPEGLPTKRDEPKKPVVRSQDRLNESQVMQQVGQ